MKKLIMLETTDKTNIILGENLLINIPGAFRGANYHLYLIDNDAEIKFNDWYYSKNLNQFEQLSELPSGDKNWWLEDCYKIISSTDNLVISDDQGTIVSASGFNQKFDKLTTLPLLSESSIKQAINYFNRTGEKEFEVEVEENLIHWDVLGRYRLNSEGKVDITIPEEEKMYSYEEMCSNMQQYLDDYYFTKGAYKTPQKWLKENTTKL